MPVYSLVCSSVGLCRWDATNGIILTVEFVHRLWFKMKIEALRFGYDRSPSSGMEKAFPNLWATDAISSGPLYGETDSCQGL